MKQLAEYLDKISPLSPETIQSVSELFRPVILEGNDFFIGESNYAKEIGFLETGIARAFFINKAGKEYNKHFFVVPTLFGAYSSLLNKQKNKIA